MWTGTSVADPGSGTFLTPGSGMEKVSESGIRDEHARSFFFGSLEKVFVLKLFSF
jgi:hypothetical protein